MTNKVLILITAVLLTISCSRDKAKDVVSSVENLAADSNLKGEFYSECIGSNLLKLKEKLEIEFKGNQFKRRQIFYNKDSCVETSEVGEIIYSGKFKVTKTKDKEPNEIDINLQKVTISPKNEFLVKTLNGLNFCGRNDYQVGVKSNITETSDNSLCPITNVPANLYGVYRVKNDRIYLGSDILEMAKKSSEREKHATLKPMYSK